MVMREPDWLTSPAYALAGPGRWQPLWLDQFRTPNTHSTAGADMQKKDVDFDTWFDTLNITVLERAGVDFKDEDSVRDDYDSGRNVFDVIDEIVAEYGD